jgi:queuosine precursor transporter
MIAVTAYFAAIVGANLSVAHFGPWISPLNSFLLIGLDLALRDRLHDDWRGRGLWPRMGLLIGGAGLVSYLLNPAAGHIAVASVVAFCAAGVVDALLYHCLRHRPYLQRSNGSNVGGAAVDSILFPTIAFGAFLPGIVALQFAAKVGGGALWAWVLSRRDVVAAKRQNREAA